MVQVQKTPLLMNKYLEHTQYKSFQSSILFWKWWRIVEEIYKMYKPLTCCMCMTFKLYPFICMTIGFDKPLWCLFMTVRSMKGHDIDDLWIWWIVMIVDHNHSSMINLCWLRVNQYWLRADHVDQLKEVKFKPYNLWGDFWTFDW